MRTILRAVVVLAMFSVVQMQGATLLLWDANPPADSVTNYTVHTVVNGVTSKTAVGTNTSANLVNFQDGKTYQFYATASNVDGESDPSETITYFAPLPPTLPAAPSIQLASWQRTTNGLWLVNLKWLPVTNATSYRVVSEQFSLNTTNSVLRTNNVAGTNWTAFLNFGVYKLSLQASNAVGFSIEALVYSPKVPGRPTGLRIQ